MLSSLLACSFGLCTSIWRQGVPVSGYGNIVLIRQYSTKLDEIVKSSRQFDDDKWIPDLGKTYVSADSKDGLLVVAELSALQGPQDRFLSKLLELGALDAKGLVVDGKNRKEFGEALAAISPFDDSRSSLTSGKFRIQVKPQIQVAYTSSNGQPAVGMFSPQPLVQDSSGLTKLEGPREPIDKKPIRAKNLVFEEFYRRPGGRTRIADAQKLIGTLANSQHEAMIRQLFTRCSDEMAANLLGLDKMNGKVNDWKDVPFDFRSMLERQHGIFTDQSSSMPSYGAISGFGFGINIEIQFAGKRQIIGILK